MLQIQRKSASIIILIFFSISIPYAVLHIAASKPASAEDETLDQKVERLTQNSVIVDLHADTILRLYRNKQFLSKEYPGAQVDIPKWKRGGVKVQFFAISSPTPDKRPMIKKWEDIEYIPYFKRVVEKHPEIEQVTTHSEAQRVVNQGKIAIVLTVEGAGLIEDKIERVQMLYDAGVRAVGPIWNITNCLGDSARDAPRWNGLSPFGKEVIKEMNRLGIMIDVSHASEKAAWDIIHTSTQPVFASHSNAMAVRRHARNLTDDQIFVIASNGGIIGVCLHRTFLRKGLERATIDDVVAHVKHLIKVGDIDCVAIGSDFDGKAFLPIGLEDTGKLPALMKALFEAGLTEDQVKKIFGENAMRYFARICP